jgi:hypothetical protein
LPTGFEANDSSLKWEEGAKKGEVDWRIVRESVRRACAHCPKQYTDTPENRRSLSTGAEWSLTVAGEDPTHVTYTIPALANFRVSYFDLVREFIKARRSWKLGDTEPFMQFVMQRASKFWKEEIHARRIVVKDGVVLYPKLRGRK